jgi:hypothetical protein
MTPLMPGLLRRHARPFLNGTPVATSAGYTLTPSCSTTCGGRLVALAGSLDLAASCMRGAVVLSGLDDSLLPTRPIMSRRSSTIGVQLIGQRFPRFVLARTDGCVWTGSAWTHDRSRALLYYHLSVIEKDYHKLLAARRRRRRT